MTVTNAEWMIKNGYKFYDLDCVFNRKEKICDIFIKHACIDTVKVHKNDTGIDTILKWLDMKHKEQILDDVEKRYLSSVIRPFKDEIQSIEKSRNWANNSDRLYFNMKNRDIFYLPNFKLGTMYKGMEPDKEYALDELGL